MIAAFEMDEFLLRITSAYQNYFAAASGQFFILSGAVAVFPPRVNPRRDFMSPVGASIYCSPHHRLRSRLTRRPATGICF